MENRNKYLDKVEELEMTIDVRNNTIFHLRKQVAELEIKVTNKNWELERKAITIAALTQQVESYKEPLILAGYYKALIKVIDENPSIQGEWVKFMTYIKLFADPEDIKGLV